MRPQRREVFRPRATIVALAAAACTATALAENLQLVRRDAYLMGTRAVLAAYAPDRGAAVAALETALDTLERTEAQLSTWREHSAISRLNHTPVGQAWQADPELCALIGELYSWQSVTGGAFDPAVGALSEAWNIHGDARVPDAAQLDAARARSGLGLLEFESDRCSVVRRADATLDVGAFGKGEALDRVARSLEGISWMIDLGGQISVGGPPPPQRNWEVDIAHPQQRDRAVLRVELPSGSLSTSGGSERDARVSGVRVGHVLDPRTGRPAPFTGSVLVWHERGLAADVLSTALYVMGPEEGLPWAEQRGIAAAYLIPERGEIRIEPTAAFGERFRGPVTPGDDGEVRLKPDTRAEHYDATGQE